jgi:cytochrome c biogenesis protein CcmG, thiol:disulfide interchange protein DsbE
LSSLTNPKPLEHIHAVILRVCLLLAVLLAGVTQAADPIKFDTLKVGQKTYSKVTVIGFNATDLYFTSDQGINNVKLRLLDPKLQKRFQFDAKSAAQIEQQREKDDLQFHESIGSNLTARAEQAILAAKKAASTSEKSLADPISEGSVLGKLGPTLVVDKWITEKPDLEGKFVLLTFWAPWSIPCRKAIPELNALQKKFPDQLVVVGVTSESEADVASMEPQIEFACGLDNKGKTIAAAKVTSIPHAVLLDPKRLILYHGHPGALNESKLQSLLATAAED